MTAHSLVLTFEFADTHRPDLTAFGEIVEETWPKIQIRVARSEVPRVLGEVLSNHAIEDVSVEDVPLEEVIATMFRISSDGLEHAN